MVRDPGGSSYPMDAFTSTLGSQYTSGANGML